LSRFAILIKLHFKGDESKEYMKKKFRYTNVLPKDLPKETSATDRIRAWAIRLQDVYESCFLGEDIPGKVMVIMELPL
jgi:hypothetical protein